MPFQLDQLASVVTPAELCAWGEDLVYVLRRVDAKTRKGWSNLWCLRGDAPLQLTRGEVKDSGPCGDDEGRFLLFLSQRSGTTQVWRLDRDGGEPRVLTAFPDGALSGLSIAPDGRQAAVLYTPGVDPHGAFPLAADLAAGIDPDLGEATCPGAEDTKRPEAHPKEEPRVRVYVRVKNRNDGQGWEPMSRPQVWLLDPSTGAARRLAAGPWAYASPRFTPRGTVLALRVGVPDGEERVDENELVEITPEGAVCRVEKPAGAGMSASMAPDGTIGFVQSPAGDLWGSRNIEALTLHPAPRRWGAELDLPALDLTIDDMAGGCFNDQAPLWTDGGFVLAWTDHGSTRLREQRWDGEGTWLTPRGKSVAWQALVRGRLYGVVTSAGAFAEVGRVRDGDIVALTAHNARVSAAAEPRAPEEVNIPVGPGQVHGWFLSPRGTPNGAGILYVHGGPHANYGTRLFFEMSWLADQGYAVLWTNPRGSTSYGEAFCAANDDAWGTVDAEDLEAAGRWLAARPGVGKVGFAGGSYGGYMSLHMAGTSRTFAAYAAQRGLFDWFSDYGESDFGFVATRMFGPGFPWQAPDRYVASSPARLVDRVEAPFLLVAQEGDMRCEESQSIGVFNALRERGVPTALVLFPEESHGMMRGGRIDRRVESMRQVEAWLRRYLVG